MSAPRATTVGRQRRASRVVLAVAGYAAARAVLAATRRADQRIDVGRAFQRIDVGRTDQRVNYRGHPVSLAGGPALTIAASVTGAAGAVAVGRPDLAAALSIAGLAAGAVGHHDDHAPVTEPKGLRGHLAALRRGQVTSGVLKVFGLTAAGIVAAATLPRARPGRGRAVEVILGAGLIAGSANLVNLLDLRPGRALKAALLVSAPLLASRSDAAAALAGPVGAAAGVLADDLAERVMLGDAGANALGAILGVAVAQRTGPVGRGLVLGGIVAATLASERWSFSQIIEANPWLRRWDRLGRLPGP